MILTAKAAILFVNLTIPKKMFKSMDECVNFKHSVKKQLLKRYNPVDMFNRMPTLTCEFKPQPKPKPKPIKQQPKHKK